MVSGRDLRNARRSQDSYGQPAVSFTLNPEGAKKFDAYTSAHIGDRMAIVLDNKVRSAPVDPGPHLRLRDHRGQLHRAGRRGPRARAARRRAPRLDHLPRGADRRPEPGARLDQPRPARGPRRPAPWSSCSCSSTTRAPGSTPTSRCVLNAVLLLGAIGLLKATLTLPGIAGIILTIGMAVDANVLIFERIREELALGKTVRNAIDLGFAAGALRDHRLQPDDDHLGPVPLPVRHRPDQGVRRDADHRPRRSRCSRPCSCRAPIFDALLSRRAKVTTLSI